MVLDNLRLEFQRGEYKPLSIQLSFDGLAASDHWSTLTKIFIFKLADRYSGGFLKWNDLYDGRNLIDDKQLLSFYIEDLDEDSKTEVLGILTFQIHELIHHIDHLITPFGVNFHTKACLEFLSLQRVIPILLDNYPNLLNGDPFILTAQRIRQDISKYPKIEQEFSELVGKIFFFDAYRPSYSPSKVKLGWNDNIKPVRLLNTDLAKVTIHGFMQTIQIPNNKRWFLSINSILECRAMCYSLLWIMYMFGYQELARNEIRRYLNGYYGKATPDYKFLIDTMSHLFGSDDFHQLVSQTSVEIIRQVLMGMAGVCWYALQAPPVMDSDSLLNSVPTVRLMFALQQLESSIRCKRQFQAFTEFLDELDQSEGANYLGIKPINDVLSFSLKYGLHILSKNQCENQNKLVLDHFSDVFESQIRQIHRRQGKGYVSIKGLPEDGNPLFGIEDDKDADDLMMEFKTNQETINWFKLRENFLFRLHRSDEIRHQLVHFFC